MVKKTLLLWLVLVAGISMVGLGGVPAELGSGFSDAYAAFAPLYAVHRSYADYLFAGTEMAVPEEVADACERFAFELAELQLRMVTQTESETVEAITYSVRLRSDTASFCEMAQPLLATMVSPPGDPMDAVQTASDAGVFAVIADLNRAFERMMDEAMTALASDEDRWVFAVTFACRTLILSPQIDRIDSNVRDIFYGSAEGTHVPVGVPDSVESAMRFLVSRIGVPLSNEEEDLARAAAETIYESMIVR